MNDYRLSLSKMAIQDGTNSMHAPALGGVSCHGTPVKLLMAKTTVPPL